MADQALVDTSCFLLHLVFMVAHVVLQVRQLCKGSLAALHFAAVRLFTCMDARVLLEVGQLLEGALTVGAGVLADVAVHQGVLR